MLMHPCWLRWCLFTYHEEAVARVQACHQEEEEVMGTMRTASCTNLAKAVTGTASVAKIMAWTSPPVLNLLQPFQASQLDMSEA